MNETQSTNAIDKVEASVWTLYSIFEHFTTLLQETDLRYNQRFIAQEKAMQVALDEKQKEIDTAFRSHEKLTESQFKAIEEKAELSYNGLDKKIDVSNETQKGNQPKHNKNSNNKAIEKVEIATEKRFESVNEFRQTLSDQTKTFITRSEAMQAVGSNVEKIDDLKSRMDRLEGRSGGTNASWMMIVQTVAMVAGLIAIFFALNK